MKRCIKCNLPENYHGIKFDENQVCNFCNFYENHKLKINDIPSLEQEFEEVIENAKKKAKENGSKYDCLVGFSGGKDSTYLVYQLKHVYGMRVLTFTFDNGFSTDYGKDNVENALEKINVDHIRISMRDEEIRKQYSRCVDLLHNFCSVCFHFVHYYSYMLAAQNNIPLIVNGRTIGQIHQAAEKDKLIEPFERAENLLDFEYQMFGELSNKLNERGVVDYLNEFSITSVSYFAYHDISEEETMKFLEEKLDWKRPSSGIPHADCWAHAMAEKMSIEKRGYPIRTGEFGVMVRMGKMSKEEAQEELAQDMERYKKVDSELEKRFYKRIAVHKAQKKASKYKYR